MSQEAIDTATAVLDFIRAVGLLVRRVRSETTSQELSWTERSVMTRLEKGGPATSADLARAEGMKPQSMGTIVAELEEMGIVQRKPHPSDGRQLIVELTAQGAALRKSARDAERTWLLNAVVNLNERERKILFAAGEIMKRLVEK